MKDLDKLYNEVKEKYNKVDIVFANAGVCRMRDITDVDEEFYDLNFNINTKGAYFSIQKALPILNDNASLIFNASIASGKGLPHQSVYCASKAAVRSMARSFANELGPRGIRVNAISPGAVDTNIMSDVKFTKEQSEEIARVYMNSLPLRRSGKPHEIANLALFLASDQSSYITGTEIAADGGMVQV